MHIRIGLVNLGYCFDEQNKMARIILNALAVAAHSLTAIEKDLIDVCQRYPAGGPNEAITYRSK